MDKYYTPERDEFCWGFEYESEEDPRTEIWEKQIVGAWSKFKYFDNDSDVDYRVKYLDKEDIESLGWKRDSLRAHQLTRQIYNKDNWMLLYDNKNHKLSLTVRDPSLNLEMMIKLRTTEVFSITIKNKSELIKLLKQLGIG